LEADPVESARLADPGADDGFALAVEGTSVTLIQRDSGKAIRSAQIVAGSANWAAPILEALAHIAQWRRSLTLANPHPKLDPAMVDFVFAEQPAGGGEQMHPGPEIQLAATRSGDSWNGIRGQLRIRNRTGQLLNYVLVHFSNEYGVEAITNEQIVPGDEFQTILVPRKDGTGDPQVSFTLDGGAETVENLKLIFSTERVDDFLLALDPLADTRGFGAADDADAAKPVANDWFAKDLHVHIVPQLDAVGPQAVSVAGGKITIDAHPQVTATVSLSTAAGPARGVGDDTAFVSRLNAAGLALPGIGGERGDSSNILQLNDISNPAALAQTPLAIRIDAQLTDGEVLVPLVNDGGHVMLAGDVWRDDDGKTQVRISKLPENPVAQRSIGSALWMYLCKAYFHADHANRLRWVEKTADGTVAHSDGVAQKVSAAKSVLLAIHGIIGDSAPMAEAVLSSGIADNFDLVLSYDYENLSTAIEDTAKTLADDLTRAGLHADDGKTLVVLAHSMGGLVARCFVEKGGGAAVVDRLVLCGTPNEGSPFGKVDSARQILTILATLALNVPALAPVCGPALAVLTYSKKLTPTLEEMAPHSPFISAMVADADAGIPVTILAGDIDKYQDDNPQFFSELLVKVGRSPVFDALFDSAANDLAVGVGSICASASLALAKAERINVACHHLNYFQCDAGIAALKALDWKA
jgi:pimeloyl-ACP methyl ester carboxylesterase